jgi:hypothetical protein
MPCNLLFVCQLLAFGVISYVLIFTAVRTSDLTTLITFVEWLLQQDNSVYFPARLVLFLQETVCSTFWRSSTGHHFRSASVYARKLSPVSDSATTRICTESYTEIIAKWRFNSASERSTSGNKMNCMTKDKLLFGALWILRKLLVTVNSA